MKNILNSLLILLLAISLAGCDNKRHAKRRPLKPLPEHRHTANLTPLGNGQYCYHDSSNDLWYYLYLTHLNDSTGSSYRVSSYTTSPQSPAQRGLQELENTDEGGPLQVITEANGALAENAEAASAATIAAEDNAAIAETEADNAATEAADASDSSDSSSSSDSSDSSSSSDSSGGSDGGGGDGGGGGD